ncbi:SCF ubiquitin ligase complex subunit [Fusarium falciforme]|uniref:SCF ubiquitin ligase complex subunit n=1 Tax=Fusarium falciforme TaxID=195108 RepID=A0A9W8V2Z4_9HYPO|nr:SCF ubiquitin ligase complex subunit [Fusarium falciforme]KAJ4250007.1 SCF ubiquitin ligase complex subunit [Fusarium falciforme]
MAASAAARPSPAPADDQDDSRSSSSSTSPAPADNEESDFFLGANDSQSSIGVPNFQDMQVEDDCQPPVNRLPNEILISIFAKLSATSDLYHSMLVCKRWARNTVDLLWHRPACTNWRNHSSICQTLQLEHPFFSYRDFIKRLNLAALADKVNDGSVLPLSVCTRVERLTLTNCRGLTDSGLIALVENSNSLLALDISNDKNITEQSITAIAEHCKRLQGLNISGCENISNESMIALANNCRYIKRLKLNECAQLQDDAIHAFANNCPNILEIDLHQCSRIGNGPVTSLMVKGNCLRELRLANCDLIDDDAFLSLPAGRHFEHLRILDLTSCMRLTDAAVQKIIDVAPRLRNLVLAKCRNITDAAVHAISKLGKNLHYVHLGHCGNITDEGVKKLVQNCNRIRYIDLGCCVNLTDESVKRLALLPKLKRIGLVKCSSITDESVLALAEAAYRPRVRRDASGVLVGGEYYASSLERVHLSYCINLSLKSIMKLLNSCPRLTHLSLTGVAAFQRDDFQPYCRQAPPEFTQHQRDVFCVFSGTMVSKFRDFLNTSPQFEEYWETNSWPRSARWDAIRAPRNSVAAQQSAAVGEGADDEMADDDNDFEGMDGSEMAVDAQVPIPVNGNVANGTVNPNQLMNNTFTQAIPVPPPPPGLLLAGGVQQQRLPQVTSHASAATLGHGGPTNGEPSTGASTATIHRPQENGEQQQQQQQQQPDVMN